MTFDFVGDAELAKLAPLCRELQRNAGDGAFICPVNAVQRLMNLRLDTQAGRLLQELRKEGVIEYVERGRPNLPGKKGKPTMWRYKLSMG